MATDSITWWQWFVRFNDVRQLWAAQPTYLISQTVFMLAGFITLVHAFKKGGRWPYFWLGTVLHGLYADNFWHILLPEYDNFWHSQTPVMLLGGRLPLHIVFLYPAFMYNAAYSVSRLNLPRYAEPFAVGLVTVLIDIPYDITAVKFVHWTWHDTDPNIFDRHYWVPWTSYYFHATFTTSFYFLFDASRRWLAPKVEKWKSAGAKTEWKSLLIATILGMPGGVLMFVPIYHPLHDHLKIHTEVTVFVLFSIYAVFIINGLASDREKVKERLSGIDYLLIMQLISHYFVYLLMVTFFWPEKEISTGFHEPVGPCDQVTSLVTPFGQTLEKRQYFCPDNYDEGYFGFSCVGHKRPKDGARWYTICGTPFANRMEYIVVISTIVIAATGIFYSMYSRPAAVPVTPKKKQKTK
ncbi:uncharacterized protein LOC114354290 [Ostrinia furnacalis]|uniref:uncharacterized protein LOC114354290 n=1 Tax=Ostrinia furnacalis TaxID=93504 RepID=UPI00103B91ED|nr:uncharacterized protein LOC114354290 [Ostrinia furnacalis]